MIISKLVKIQSRQVTALQQIDAARPHLNSPQSWFGYGSLQIRSPPLMAAFRASDRNLVFALNS